MTQAEKLLARLRQLQGHAVTLLVIVGADGQPVVWAIQDDKKLEGGQATIGPEGHIENDNHSQQRLENDYHLR